MFKARYFFMFLAILLTSGQPSQSNAEETVNVIMDKTNLTSAVFAIGLARGYFDQEGVNVEIIAFRGSSVLMTPFIASGKADMALGAPNAAFFNAINQGFNVRIIADTQRQAKGHSSNNLMVRQDLYDNGTITKVEDIAKLKGIRLSFGTEGSPFDYFMTRVLQKLNLTKSDVTVLYQSRGIDYAALFKNKVVDAQPVLQPFSASLQEKGFGVTIAGQGDIMESVQGSLLLASEKVLQDRPEVVQRFLKAYVKGIRDITDQGNEWDPKILDILSQWTGLPKEILAKLQTPYVDRNGKVDVKSIMDQYQFWKDNGIVKGSFDVRKSVDLSNLEKALMQMGN